MVAKALGREDWESSPDAEKETEAAGMTGWKKPTDRVRAYNEHPGIYLR